MNNSVGSRLVTSILLPLAVLLAVGGFVGTIAVTLLYNTKAGSLMLAAVAAGGILFTVSLANTQDRLTVPKRGVVLLAAALPIIIGGAVGLGLIGGVDDADRMVNVQPLLVVPDDAPVIAAENSSEFCVGPQDACEPITEWDVVPSTETDDLVFIFDNFEPGVPHNVVITDLEGSVDDPQPGATEYASSELINGVARDAYVSAEYTWDDLPDEWYFYCLVHPAMNGVGRVVAEG